MKALLTLATALVALTGCSAGADNTVAPVAGVTAVAPPAGTDWVATVVMTPEGGFRMGNPDAKIKLLEYGSVTCPTCQRFSSEGMTPLKANYVATGKVSYEFRSFLIHGPDVMATSLLQCGGPGPFFALLETNFAELNTWEAKLQQLAPAEAQRLQTQPIAVQNVTLARASGLDQLVIQRGVGADAARQCLTDPATPDKLLNQRDRGISEFKVEGTPSFFINGTMVEGVVDWKGLEPQLKAAGA